MLMVVRHAATAEWIGVAGFVLLFAAWVFTMLKWRASLRRESELYAEVAEVLEMVRTAQEFTQKALEREAYWRGLYLQRARRHVSREASN
jgi:hypothetical protein